MYQLEHTYYFYLLLVIPLMILGFLALNRWKNNTQNKYISSDLLKVLSPDISTFKPKVKLFLFSLFIVSPQFL